MPNNFPPDPHSQSPDEVIKLVRQVLSQSGDEFASFAETHPSPARKEENAYINQVNERLESYLAWLHKIVSQLENFPTDQVIFLPIVKDLQDSENLMQCRASARTCAKLQMEEPQDPLRVEQYYVIFIRLQKALWQLADEIKSVLDALE